MAVRKSTYPAPAHLDANNLGEPEGALVLLPDTLSPVDGQLVAAFREGAQALRVRAKQEGVPVEVVVPDGARPGRYSEHSADWVLPLILGVPAATVALLIGNEVQRRIDSWREQGRSRMPTLRYREVIVDQATHQATVRELEGPADEVSAWIAQRSALGTGPESQKDEWQWSKDA